MASLVGGTILGKDGVKNIVLEAGANDYTFAWDAPAGARQLNIADPLGNDTFVFLAATQTLTNKTISGLIVTDFTRINATGELRLMDADNSNYVGFKSPATVTTNTIYTLPAAAVANNFLKTDVNGVTSWESATTQAYSTVQEEGASLTQRSTLNFIGAAITAADNVTKTDVTLSQSPTASTSVVGTGRVLTSGGGLTGGGDLTADRTLAVGAGTGITVNADDVAVDQAFTPTWTGLHTFNPGTTPTDAALLAIAQPGVAGTRDSHNLVLRGTSFDTGGHNADWKAFVDVTSNAGASTWTLQSRIDAAAFGNRLTVDDAGNVIIPGTLTVSGATTTVSSSTMTVVDKNITVNQGGNDAASEGAGLTVARTGTAGSLIYKDASATKFAIGAAASEVDVVGISSTQTLTNKTIAGGSNTITGLLHGTQVDNPSTGVHGVTGAVVGTTDTQTLTNKTLSTGTNLAASLDANSNDITELATMTQANALAAGKDWTLGDLGTATVGVQGYDSQFLVLRGSGWSGVAEAMLFKVMANVASSTSAKLLIQKKVGAASAVNLLSLNLAGDLSIAGVFTEAATITEL